MAIDRRTALTRMSLLAAAAAWPGIGAAQGDPQAGQGSTPTERGTRLRKIATEEAFTIPEMIEPMREVLRRGGSSLDLTLLGTIYGEASGAPPQAQPTVQAPSGTGKASSNRDALARLLLPKLLDLDAARLADMDANGVDMQLLSLSMPGVQILERETAAALARVANDRLSEAEIFEQ